MLYFKRRQAIIMNNVQTDVIDKFAHRSTEHHIKSVSPRDPQAIPNQYPSYTQGIPKQYPSDTQAILKRYPNDTQAILKRYQSDTHAILK